MAKADRPVPSRCAARRTSAATASRTCAGLVCPSRCLQEEFTWTFHRPIRAVAAICGSGSLVLSPARWARMSRAASVIC